jgi:hypothetical protein
MGKEYFNRGKLKDRDIGGHASLGAEYFINKNLALTFEGGYTFAKLKNFTGHLVDQDGTSREMQIVWEGDENREIIVHSSISGTYKRPAAVNFSGFKISLGLKYFFQKEWNR